MSRKLPQCQRPAFANCGQRGDGGRAQIAVILLTHEPSQPVDRVPQSLGIPLLIRAAAGHEHIVPIVSATN